MKIVLATLYVHPFYPLACYQLDAAVRQSRLLGPNDKIEVVALPLQLWKTSLTMEADTELLSMVIAANPDVLALSAYMWNSKALLELANDVRQLCPSITIIIGGPDTGDQCFATNMLEKYKFLDYVIIGEGETPFVALLSALAAGEDPCAVPQVISRGNCQTTTLIGKADLESYPTAHSSTWRERHSREKIFLLETYRGCRNRCAYCVWSGGQSRPFPLERVARELAIAADADCNQIYLIDPFFGVDNNHIDDLLTLMEGYRGMLNFYAFIRPGDLTVKRLAAFRNVGLHPMNTGVQSCSERGARTIGRAMRIDSLHRELKLMDENGVRARSIDIIYGIPGDKLEDLKRTINLLEDFPSDEINMHRLLVLPGTRLSHLPATDLIYHQEPPYSVLKTSSMSLDDLLNAKRIHIGGDWAQRFFKSTSQAIRQISKLDLATYWLRLGAELAAQPDIGLDFDPFDWLRKLNCIHMQYFTVARQAVERVINDVIRHHDDQQYVLELSRFESYKVISAQAQAILGYMGYTFSSVSIADIGRIGPWHEQFQWDFRDVVVDANAMSFHSKPKLDQPITVEFSINKDGSIQVTPM